MLTPIDIQNKDFDIKFRGYDSTDVDDFMEMVTKDYEKLYKENIELKEKLNASDEMLDKYKTMESTLQNSIILAQSASEDIRKNANGKADNIVQEAELKASEIIKQATRDVAETKNQLSALKMEVSSYKARLKSICASLGEMIEKID